MSDFNIRIPRAKEEKNQMKNIERRIDAIGDEIDTLARQSGISDYHYYTVRKNLRRVSSALDDEKNKVRLLAKTLNQVISLYEKTEKKLCRVNGRKLSELEKKADKIRNDLIEISGTIGMDPGAIYSDDPVNMSNGNYVYEKTFFNFDTPLSMNLRIFYNANDIESGALGYGWNHNFERRIISDQQNFYVIDEDASRRSFEKNEDGTFTALPGTLGSLVHIQDGSIYTNEARNMFLFDHAGKLISIENPDGWKISLHYENEKLMLVDCTDGISLSFLYDADGKLVSVSDQAGRSIQFHYEDGLFSEVCDAAERITKYQYDENRRLYKIISPSGALSVQNIYDESGRTLRQDFADGGSVFYSYDDEEGSITMQRQNGSEVTYFHDSLYRNVKTVYPDGEEKIDYNIHQQRTSFTDKLGRVSRYAYDAEGRLSVFQNALGNQLILSYHPNGQVEKLMLDHQLLGKSEYDEKGHQIQYTNANGDAVKFAYDSLGRVTSVIHEDESETELTYDAQGNVICVQDPLSGCTKYEYDICRRVIRSTDALGNQTGYEYDAADQLTAVINAAGERREYQYDARGNLTKIIDFNGGIRSIEYNAMNRPIQITDADQNTTKFEYDLMSNPIRKIAADGGVTEYEYDTEGRMVQITYPMGGKETAEYDAVGNLIKRYAQDGGEYHFSYDDLDRVIAVRDTENRVRRAEYDLLGNVTAVYYEDGTEEKFTYDLMGNQLSHTNQAGYTRYFEYNALQNITKAWDDEGVLAEYTYGAGGRILSEKRADGAFLQYRYDLAGNITELIDNTRGNWKFTYNCIGRMCKAEHIGVGTEYYTYDALGNITSVIDGEGNETGYAYSKAGALEKVTDAKGMETHYRYDPCYRINKIIQMDKNASDENQISDFAGQPIRQTTYEWDQEGRVTSILDSLGGRISYGYDACGRITSKIDQEGHRIACSYRKDSTEDILTFSNGYEIKYQYDALKRLSQIEDWLGITRISRDAMGRMTEMTDSAGDKIGYEWDQRGQCREISYPDGKKAIYDYDQQMHLTRCIYDTAEVQYSYYENGQLRERRLPEALHTKYTYDMAGRIAELTHNKEDQQLSRYVYSYDLCSRKNKIMEQHGEGDFTEYALSYDPIGCLKTVMRNGMPYQSYEYDGFGNRIQMNQNGKNTTYGYDVLDQLKWSKTDCEERRYSYDKRGNLIGAAINGAEKLTLHFDALDRLAKASSDQGEAEYIYNGLAHLAKIRRTQHGHTSEERLIYDYGRMQNRLLAQNKEGLWEGAVWDFEPLFSQRADKSAFYLNDERGTATGIFENSIYHREQYDPFGVITQGTVANPLFTYTGYRYDPITGFYDGGWRQYDAENGRFISKDPVAGTISNPLTLNPYIYCMSNPINYIDPSSMIAAWLASGIVGSIVNVGAKFAGDVANSIVNGKWTGSSWQSYVGAAAGGFVQGTVLVVAGPAAAGAAGAATETLLTNGLNMATGVEGYRKEDGYGLGNLLSDTAVSTANGAISGFTFGAAAKYLKIPKITSGQGNFAAVWKQVTTKAQKGLISNISTKTMMKGIVSYGVVGTADAVICNLIDRTKEEFNNSIEAIKNDFIQFIVDDYRLGRKLPCGFRNIFRTHPTATCSTT